MRTRCRPARPYFAAFDETTHDFVLVLEDLGRLRGRRPDRGMHPPDAETVIDAVARQPCSLVGKRHDRWLRCYGSRHSATPPFRRQLWRAISRLPGRVSSRESAPICPRSWVSSASGGRRRRRGSSTARATAAHLSARRPPARPAVFAVGGDDPPVTALDWQITDEGSRRIRRGLLPEPEPDRGHPTRL